MRPESFHRGAAGDGDGAAKGGSAAPGFRGHAGRPLVMVSMGTIFGRTELLSSAVADQRYVSTACHIRDEITAMPSPDQVATSHAVRLFKGNLNA